MQKKTQWPLLLVAAIMSIGSVIVLSISMASNFWITAEAKFDDTVASLRNNEVHYGLFKGSLTSNVLVTPYMHDLSITCDYSVNSCIYSCQLDSELQKEELQILLNGETPKSCPVAIGKRINTAKISTDIKQLQSNNQSKFTDEFLNAALWISVVIFLALAITSAAISAALALLNISFNPPQTILSVFGLHIWNAITVALIVITMSLYISLCGVSIYKNIAIPDTLKDVGHYSSNGLASLGWAYWILIVPMIFQAASTAVLKYRQKLIDRAPPEQVITVEKNDFTSILF